MTRWWIPVLCAAWACAPKTPTSPAAAPTPAPTPQAAAPEAASEAPAPARRTTPVHELVNRAAKRMEGEDVSPADLEQAIGLLEQALEQEPANPLIRLNLGVAKHLSGDLAAAQREYQAAVGQDPTLGRAWLLQGRIHLDQGRPTEAESTWRAGIRKAPADMELRVALIDLLRTTGRTEEALKQAKEALRENANSVEIYNVMGLCYQDLDDLVMARFVYQKALAGIPGADENAWLHLNLGWTYYLDGNAPLAVIELERALELDPYLVPALVNLSRIYMDDRNYGDTVPLLERALSRAPDDPGVRMNLGIAYRGVGRFREAEAEYREVMKLDPDNPTPWFNLGILFGDYVKDYDKAVDAFNQYLSAGGPDRERAEQYITLVKREKKRVEKRKKAEEERKRREAERAEEERLLQEALKQQQREARKRKEEAPEEPPPVEEGTATPEAPAGEPAAEEGPWGEGSDAAPDPEPAVPPEEPADDGPEENPWGAPPEPADPGGAGPDGVEPSEETEPAESPWGDPG